MTMCLSASGFQLQWYRFIGAIVEPTAATLSAANEERLSHARRVVELIVTRIAPRNEPLASHLLTRMTEVAELAPEAMPWTFGTPECRSLVREVIAEVRP